MKKLQVKSCLTLGMFLLINLGFSAVHADETAVSDQKPAPQAVPVTVSQQEKPAVTAVPVEKKTEDKNRVLVTVNGTSLTAAQADILLEHRLGRDMVQVVQAWIDIRIRSNEARKRGLDKKPGNDFILKLFADNYLANRILNDDITSKMPPVTEKDARKFYQENISRFQKPMRISFQHLTVQERDLAVKIVAEARKPDAKFDDLVEKYTTANDKQKKGFLPQMTIERIVRVVGAEAAKALKKSKVNDILGPTVGVKGFEVMKVQVVEPLETRAFEDDEVKGRIFQQLKSKNASDKVEKTLQDIKAQAEIVKSQELQDLEKKAQGAKPNMPGRPVDRPPASPGNTPPRPTAKPPK